MSYRTTMGSVVEREVVSVSWPMTIPAHAKFFITSPYVLRASYRQNVSFVLTLDAPIHLSSPSPVDVIPFGILSPGFARGWIALPTELKLAILRYNLIVSFTIWPGNANRVMHDILFHYLRMTTEIATLSRELFFNENTFIVLPFREQLSVFRGLPPPSVRPLIRRLTLLTWLDPSESETIETIAANAFGFERLTHVEIRCSVVKFVRTCLLEQGLGACHSAGEWSARLNLRLAPSVCFETKGMVIFDRHEFESGSTDRKLLELVTLVEGLVKQRFHFRVGTQGRVDEHYEGDR